MLYLINSPHTQRNKNQLNQGMSFLLCHNISLLFLYHVMCHKDKKKDIEITYKSRKNLKEQVTFGRNYFWQHLQCVPLITCARLLCLFGNFISHHREQYKDIKWVNAVFPSKNHWVSYKSECATHKCANLLIIDIVVYMTSSDLCGSVQFFYSSSA